MPPDHPIERPPYDLAAEGDTLGVRHVEVALSDYPFPATAKELRERIGQWRMPITGTHFHTLADMLEGVKDRARFRNAEAVARAIAEAHPVLREK